MRLRVPNPCAVSSAIDSSGRCWPASGSFAPGEVVDVPVSVGHPLVKRHGFAVLDGTVLPDRHPEDWPWTWDEVITRWRVRG